MFVNSLEVEDPTSFRLVTIPPDEDSGLHLNISDASFKKSRYYCLSYTWEPSRPQHQVWLNKKPFLVGYNLWLFLNSARSAGLNTPIWIDAISIDQENVEQRNQSVSRMGDIYANAERVFLWLGQLKRRLQAFLVDLKKLGTELSVHEHRRDRRTAILARIGSMNNHSRTSWERNAIDILSLPYFERLWVAQEILLSDAAHVWLDGTDPLDMDIFSEIMIAILSRQGEDALSQMSAMPGYKYIWWHYTTSQESRVIQGPIDLASLLPRFAESKCQLTIDRVYALLSLATNGDRFNVDYNIDAAELFARTMEFSMDGRPIDSLLLVGADLLELLQLLPRDSNPNHESITVTQPVKYVSKPIFRTSTLHLSPTSYITTPAALITVLSPPNDIHLFEYAFSRGTSTSPARITHCRTHEHLNPTNSSPLPTPTPAQLHDKAYHIHTSIPSEDLHYFARTSDAPPLHSWASPPLDLHSLTLPEEHHHASFSQPLPLLPHLSSSSTANPSAPSPSPQLTPSQHSLTTNLIWDAYFQRSSSQIFSTVKDAVAHEIWTQLRPSKRSSNALVGTGRLRKVAPLVVGVGVGGKDGSQGVGGGDAITRSGRRGAGVRVTREMLIVRRIVCVRWGQGERGG